MDIYGDTLPSGQIKSGSKTTENFNFSFRPFCVYNISDTFQYIEPHAMLFWCGRHICKKVFYLFMEAKSLK